MPEADILYACDEAWWLHHIEAVKRDFKGQLYTQYHNDKSRAFAVEHGLTAVEGVHGEGYSDTKIRFASNSGHQAICLAAILGASRIILLGYDMSKTGGKNHWFGDHPAGMANGISESLVPKFSALANALKNRGIEVINCSRETALTQFQRSTIDEF